MSTKPKFNVGQCGIDDIGFIVCKNIEGVVGVLQQEGYPIEKMTTVENVYGYTMKFLDEGGQQAQEKLMRVHPHKAYILEAEENAERKSNFNEEKKTENELLVKKDDANKNGVALNLKKEHIFILVVVFVLILLMIPKKQSA